MKATAKSPLIEMTKLRQVPSVSIVIPSYNMAWCIGRAIRSCQSQSFPVHEIIIVDDHSSDATPQVVAELVWDDARIKYFRSERNGGHLAALRVGVQKAASDWIALLDADDELTPESIAARINATVRYSGESGVVPQLVYGDHYRGSSGFVTYFPKLEGNVFPFLCRELSLCQTSTIMLGKVCLPHFPASNNPWNTDDEIVLAIGKRFPILHSGAVVAIYHAHSSASRMGNNAFRRFRGVSQLVRDHRDDVFRTHGAPRLLLWYLRVLKAFLDYKIKVTDEMLSPPDSILIKPWARFRLQVYRTVIWRVSQILEAGLRPHFDHMYF